MLPLLLACTSVDDRDVEVPTEGADTGEAALQPVFSFVVLADPHVTGPGDNADRLAAAVAWIADEHEARDIELVLIVGDIGWTDEGLAQAYDTLSDLPIPWVPIVGDNEIQLGSEEGFDTTFGPQYAALADELENFRRGDTPVDNPEIGAPSWFQDVAFDHRGVHFVGLDWCTRATGGLEGEMADLHDFEGGTWGWLESDLAGIGEGPDDRVVFGSHHPMHMSPGAFDIAEVEALDALLFTYEDAIFADYAGHYHGNGEEADPDRPLEVIVTDATWDDENTLRLVDVSGNDARFAYDDTLVELPEQR